MSSQEVKKKETIIEHLKHTIQASSTVPHTNPSPPPPLYDGIAAPPLFPSTSHTNLDAPPFASGTAENDTLHEWSDTESRDRITENLRRALSVNDRTNRAGCETVAVLGRQKEVLHHTLESVGETRENLVEARRNIRRIRMGVYKEYLWKGLTIFLLLVWLCLVIYLRFVRRK